MYLTYNFDLPEQNYKDRSSKWNIGVENSRPYLHSILRLGVADDVHFRLGKANDASFL
jgi:hypothetical protein